jgi:hypothetical protein
MVIGNLDEALSFFRLAEFGDDGEVFEERV